MEDYIVKGRTSLNAKKKFKVKIAENETTIDELVNLLVDAFISKPEETISALKSLKK